jgi:ADP-ribosyl-[dinitrogen reductase] hydrolase
MTIPTDRLRGIAVGAAIGDALGMPLEFQQASPAHAMVTEMIKGTLPAGTFTDDTEMALALAESLLITHPLDPNDLAGRFVGWYQSSPSDIGIHTRNVLGMIARGTPWREASTTTFKARPDNAANGSLMRCWPVAIACWDNPSYLVVESRLQSEVTHMHQDCVDACVFTNLLISKIVNGKRNLPAGALLREGIASAIEQVAFDADFRTAIELAPVRARKDLPNTGWVRHTLESALWAVLTTQSFEEALVQAVNLGHDADTTGTVTGAIAGAMYGFSGIPTRWRDVLHGEYPLRSKHIWLTADFVKLADDLAALSAQN